MVINSVPENLKQCDTSRLTYMKGRMDIRTDVWMVDDVMVIKPNFLALMGYQYFLSYGAPRSSAIKYMRSFFITGIWIVLI